MVRQTMRDRLWLWGMKVNALQETVQPEGDTNVERLADRIGEIAAGHGRPVIVKEVGAGLGPEDAELLLARGVRILDVAGSGGTSWSRIEYHRHPDHEDRTGLVFQDWGLPTPEALRLLRPLRDRVTPIASGGIRSGLDMAKAVVLGAELCGLASPFLHPAARSADAVRSVIRRLREEFVTAMFLMGIRRVEGLRGNHALIR